MNRLAAFVAARPRLSLLLLAGITLLLALASGWANREYRSREQLSLLKTEVARRSIEIMSQTLNGNLMGSTSLLGMISEEIKQEALGKTKPNESKVVGLLESVARSYDADGVFVVGESGVVQSSWDNSGKPSTGLDVKFRPYYQMAMQGMPNVYAAVSLARGDRALYFSTPVFSGTTNGTDAIGAVVARTGLLNVDDLLKRNADIALLLSPQGVVFAGSRTDWIGRIDTQPTPERLRAIRELKQFGRMFEDRAPTVLPIAVTDGLQSMAGQRFAVAGTSVQWNDPAGDWKLVLMEDLARSVPIKESIQIALATGIAAMIFGVLILNLLKSRHVQVEATERIKRYALEQEQSAERKAQLGLTSALFQRASGLADLAQIFLIEAHRQLGALQGTVYILDTASNKLQLTASFACSQPPPEELVIGEGILGQCAADQTTRIIDASEDGFWNIRSGLGEARPNRLLLAPMVLQSQVLGVVEIAVWEQESIAHQEHFEELISMLTMNVEILRRNIRTEEMLSAKKTAEREVERMADIERFNHLAQDREARIIELKEEVNQLAQVLGRTLPYRTSAQQDTAPFSPTVNEQTTEPSSDQSLSLAELVDLDELQVLFSNFCNSIGIAAAIIDLDGKVLAASRWQRACTDFHRVNPASCARCIESDTDLALKLKEGEDFTMYTCKNGMTDCASPIIVEGQHLANVFIGQFHLTAPDATFFAAQAKQFNFPETEYLQAVNDAPVMDEKRLPVILGFLSGFARMVTTMSLARYRADAAQTRLQMQADQLKRERIAALSLAEDAEKARRALEQSHLEQKT